MLRLTLAQMRRSLGRLVAAAVAIAIGTAFVAATLLAGNVMTRTTYDAVGSRFADADLVVSEGEVTPSTLEAVAAVPGVEHVHGYLETAVEVTGPDGQTVTSVTSLPDDPSLDSTTLTEGEPVAATDEIALPEGVAQLLGVGLGDTVDVGLTVFRESDGALDPTTAQHSETMRVVGLLDSAEAAFLGTGGVAVVAPTTLDAWLTFESPEEENRSSWYALVSTTSATPVSEVQAAVQAAVGGGLVVRTFDEQAAAVTAEVSGDADQLLVVVLGFAAVALLVAALVIANTFQVLVAQRTRTLALLRCVGAERSQLRRSVVLEATLLGVASSVGGLVLATGVVQAALLVLGRTAPDVPLPATVTITATVVLVPLALGTVVTVLAALSPARAATRVPPVAALRPADAPRVAERSGRVRAAISAALVVLGVLGLVAGVVGSSRELMLGLAVGVLGGAVSFVGVVLGAVFWVPRLVGGLGALLGRRPAARLAAANSVRNPRRTAATSAALFIGVTLVAMMSTGAASARTALDDTLDEQFPVDVEVGAWSDGLTTPALPSGLAASVEEMSGVAAITGLRGLAVDVTTADGADVAEQLEVQGVDPEAARGVVHAPEQLAPLDDASVVVPADVAGWTGIEDGQTLVLRAAGPVDGGTAEAAGAELEVTARVTELPGQSLVLSDRSLTTLAPQAPVTRIWVRLDDTAGASDVVTEITAAASDTGAALETLGAAVERAFYQRVVDTLLAVVVGLLGVAVVIALVGVTNTLSLSVIERRRESATLRAIGLSRGQLRATLAIEGMLIAGVGALVGTVLGTLYGWAGARTLLGQLSPFGLTVPWRDLALVLLVALVAGLLASVVPARAAARTSPVQALAVE